MKATLNLLARLMGKWKWGKPPTTWHLEQQVAVKVRRRQQEFRKTIISLLL